MAVVSVRAMLEGARHYCGVPQESSRSGGQAEGVNDLRRTQTSRMTAGRYTWWVKSGVCRTRKRARARAARLALGGAMGPAYPILQPMSILARPP